MYTTFWLTKYWVLATLLTNYITVGVWLLPWRWHIRAILLIAGRWISAETCGLDNVFPPDDLCSRQETLCWYVSIRMHYLYEFWLWDVLYICTHTRSVVWFWWSCTPSQCKGLALGRAWFLCWMPLGVFFDFIHRVLLSDKTNTRMLVTIGIRLKQHFVTRYFAFCNLSSPRMFFFVPGHSFRMSYSTLYQRTP